MTMVQTAGMASSADGATLTATLGAAPSVGNLLVLVANADTTIGTPSGWTLAVSAVDNTGLYLWWRAVQAGDPAAVTISLSAARSAQMVVMEYSGQSASPLDEVASSTPGGTGQTSVTTGVTGETGQGDELAVVAAGRFDASAGSSATWSAGYDPVASLVSSGSAVNDALYVATRTLVATGAYSATATFDAGTSHPGGLIATFRADVAATPSRGVMAPGTHAVGSMAGVTGSGAVMAGATGSGASMSGGG